MLFTSWLKDLYLSHRLCITVVSLYVFSCLWIGFTVLPLGTGVDMLATTDPDFEDKEEPQTPVYEKHDKLLHGPAKSKQ